MLHTGRLIAILTVAMLTGLTLAARQPAGPDLRFEAASIRPAPAPGPPISGTTITANRMRGTNVTLFALVRGAYFSDTLVSDTQFIGGPDWIRSERYQFEAVAQGTPTRTDFNVMLRNLLADRFGLVVSRGRRELPVFTLRLARDDGRLGPRLTRVTVDCTAYRAAFERGERPSTAFNPNAPKPTQCDTLMVSNPAGMRIAGSAVDIGVLARTLVSSLGGVVIDRTGLAGAFDFELEFVRDMPGQAPGTAAALADGVPLATALREQLGLRIERETAPVDVLVIESATRPTPN